MNQKLKIIFIIIVIALITIILWKKYPFAETKNAISSQSPNAIDIATIKIPNFYSQIDPNWASDKLGNTHESVGKVGCLISSVAMNFSYYGIEMNPKELNQKLRELEGYTSRGWLIWDRVIPLSNKTLHVSFSALSHESIENSLLQKKPVLAKVFINRIIPHWVLIVGKRGHEYLMLDPLTNGALTKLSSYGGYIYSIRVLGK